MCRVRAVTHRRVAALVRCAQTPALGVLTLLLLATCGRPLTDGERAFAFLVHGPTLDTATVRLHDGLAPAPPRTVPVRPFLACRDRIWPPPPGPIYQGVTSAMAIFQSIHFHDRWYRDDFMAEWPEQLDLAAALLFAHEMVHVWQWQNRAVTGYHPLKAALEHAGSPDPYLFDTTTTGTFLDYGYEQQAAILEELVCCQALAPKAPRTARLRAMLEPWFALPPEGRPLANEVWLPWAGADLTGICD